MSELLKLLVFNIGVVIGVNFVTGKDQLLQGVGDNVRKLPENLQKPLTECAPCMSSVWGTICFWMFTQERGIRRLLLYPFYILGLCGAIRLILMVLEPKEPEHGRD